MLCVLRVLRVCVLHVCSVGVVCCVMCTYARYQVVQGKMVEG